MSLTEAILHTENLFTGRVITLNRDTVRLPDGAETTREIAHLTDAVCVLVLDEQERALVVEQFRCPYRQVLFELPAGKMEPGEEPAQTAVRELMEETGYRPGQLIDMGPMYPTPGCVAEVIHLFVATGLEPAVAAPDADEFINAYFMPLQAIARRIDSGEVADAKTQILVMRYLYRKGLTAKTEL